MPKQICLPEIAESVVEGEILEWYIGEGEHVDEDQPLLEVSSDKVTVEIPSPYAGTLVAHRVSVGDTVAVHAPIADIALDNEPEPTSEAEQAAPDVPDAAQEDAPDGDEDEDEGEDDDGDRLSLFKPGAEDEPTVKSPFSKVSDNDTRQTTDAAQAATNRYGRVLAVPSARILARELGVELHAVAGSGPNGRIRVADVRGFAEGPVSAASEPPDDAAAGTALPPPVRYVTPDGYADRETRTPLAGVRRAIARQMSASHLYAARTLTVDEADMSALAAMRTRMQPRAQASGVRLSYLPFVFKAIVAGLRAFPMLNTSLDEQTQEIVHKAYYNLGLAVATDAGLVVPVLRDVDQKPLLQLAREINELAEGARQNQLAPAQMKGSSFSVTNIGPIGALMSFPIINVPDAAILGVHSIRKRPVVRGADDEIVVRPMMYLSLSFDHRLVDGAEAARFCRHVIGLLEDPDALVLEAL
jgi:pyruvate dehydrogenase E2 component (dihydrolipoamide acetyltransferase)